MYLTRNWWGKVSKMKKKAWGVREIRGTSSHEDLILKEGGRWRLGVLESQPGNGWEVGPATWGHRAEALPESFGSNQLLF
jgi:hypothetical protein